MAQHFALGLHDLPPGSPEEASIAVEEAMTKPRGSGGGGIGGAARPASTS